MAYNNWIRPDAANLKQEYHVEYTLKHLGDMLGDPWPTFEDFQKAAAKAKPTVITPDMDRRIDYRSGTKSKSSLLSLIKSYRSYPEFRNEKTLDNLYARLKNNETMTMPIVLRFPDSGMRVMAGNTRMDVAFQLGINPTVLLIDAPAMNEMVREEYDTLAADPNMEKEDCLACNGTGTDYGETCVTCGGEGQYWIDKRTGKFAGYGFEEDTTTKYTEAKNFMAQDTFTTILEAVRTATKKYRVREANEKTPTLNDWTMAKIKSTIEKYVGDPMEQLTHRTTCPSAFANGINRGQEDQNLTPKIVDEVNLMSCDEEREAWAAGFASTRPVKMKESFSKKKVTEGLSSLSADPGIQEEGGPIDPHLRLKLLSALTNYDKKQSTRPGYNRYALPQYMGALQMVDKRVAAGDTLRTAITNSFVGRILDVLFKAIGEQPATNDEIRGWGPASKIDEDAPAMAAGNGAIAGIGVGLQGEPGIRRRRQ